MSKENVAYFIENIQRICFFNNFRLIHYNIVFKKTSYKTYNIKAENLHCFLISDGLVDISMDGNNFFEKDYLGYAYMCGNNNESLDITMAHYLRMKISKDLTYETGNLKEETKKVCSSLETGANIIEELKYLFNHTILESLIDENYDKRTDYVLGDYNGYEKYLNESSDALSNKEMKKFLKNN